MNNIELVSKEKELCNLATELLVMGVIRRPKEQNLLMALAEEVDEIIPRFEPIAPTDGHFFDVRKNSEAEITKVYIEELKTCDLTKKITTSDPVVTVGGIPQIKFSEYNPHARAEFEATQKEFILAKKGCNLIFWISAEDGGEVYNDGRFNIVFADKIGKEHSLRGKHLELGIDRFQSFVLGKRLVELGGKVLGKIETVDDLRVQPIGFELENMGDWINECRKMMPEYEVFWKKIENGDDLREAEVMQKKVEESKKIARGDNVIFQREMEKRGVEINKTGNHGSGYLNSIQNYTIQEIGGQFYTEPVRDANGKLICPVCGEEVGDGVSVCPKCKINLK